MASKSRFRIRSSFYFVFAAAILLIPLQWILAWSIAVFVHEMFHYISLRIFRLKPAMIDIGPYGVHMNTVLPPGLPGCICTISGPLGSFLLVILGKLLPRTAVCAFAQGLFNLLPVYPLDGGRLLRQVLYSFTWGRAVNTLIESVVIICLFLIAVFGWMHIGTGPAPFIFVGFLVFRRLGLKFPCKRRQQALQ